MIFVELLMHFFVNDQYFNKYFGTKRGKIQKIQTF